MKILNTFLFVTALLLLFAYFFVSLVASIYAITEGWGMSILIVFASICLFNLLIAAYIRIKQGHKNFNKSLNVVTIILSVIIILLTIKSMVGINSEIELHNTIKNFTN
jgi:hypothetical protein